MGWPLKHQSGPIESSRRHGNTCFQLASRRYADTRAPMRALLRFAFAAALAAAALPGFAGERPAETRGYIEVRGSRIYVETFGSGVPLLFLHGGLHYFDNSFAAQREYFAAFRKVIGVDRPGHGHSPDNGRPLTYQAMADD